MYTVDPAVPVPGSCEGVKTVAIPFAYSPYLSDKSLGLRLTWHLREPLDNEAAVNRTRGSYKSRNIGKLISFSCFSLVGNLDWTFGWFLILLFL